MIVVIHFRDTHSRALLSLDIWLENGQIHDARAPSVCTENDLIRLGSSMAWVDPSQLFEDHSESFDDRRAAPLGMMVATLASVFEGCYRYVDEEQQDSQFREGTRYWGRYFLVQRGRCEAEPHSVAVKCFLSGRGITVSY